MPTFAAKPATTVQQRPPRFLTKTLGLIVFVAVAAAAYSWKYRELPPPPAASYQAAAKVLIHQPTFDSSKAWREILAQAKPEIRDHLRFDPIRSAEATTVEISLDKSPQEGVSPLLNMVASAFVQACRSQWKTEVETAYSKAQEKLVAAQREAADADVRLELLRKRQSEAMDAARQNPEPAPAMVENPQWTEASRRLAGLEGRRRVLLDGRTPLHPSVQEIEMRIGDLRREMAAIPPQITQRPAAETAPPQSLPAGPSPAELRAAQEDAIRSHDQIKPLVTAARAALAVRSEVLRIDLAPAEAPPHPASSPRFAWSLLGASLFTAGTSVVGLGMISFGASLEPVLTSVGELQSVLPVPVLGILPAVHPTQSSGRSAFRRRLARAFTIAFGLLLIAAVAWAFLAV
jgi:hypothetical protein